MNVDSSSKNGRIATDVGGTFTDLLHVENGQAKTVKCPSTPESFEQGIIRKVRPRAAGRRLADRVTLADARPLLVNSNDYDPADLWVTVFPTDGERTNQDNSAFAFFGQVNYDLSEVLELTLALRYDEEERKAFDERVRFTADSTVEDTFSELQPKISAAWSAAENAMVSDYNFTASVDFNHLLANGRWLRARLSGNAIGPRSFDIFNDLTGESGSHFFVDASVGLSSDDWTVSLYASNLTDEDAAETVFFFNPLIRFPNQPRQAGVRARYNF